VNLRGVADLTLPEGFVFLEDAPARAMLQQLGAVTSGNEIGFIAPASHDWFVVVLFLDSAI
jgi:uncharacterized membrane-anchored protein